MQCDSILLCDWVHQSFCRCITSPFVWLNLKNTWQVRSFPRSKQSKKGRWKSSELRYMAWCIWFCQDRLNWYHIQSVIVKFLLQSHRYGIIFWWICLDKGVGGWEATPELQATGMVCTGKRPPARVQFLFLGMKQFGIGLERNLVQKVCFDK